MSATKSAVRNPVLDDVGIVKYRYEHYLPLAEIDMERSKRFQTRPGEALLQSEVERYAQALKQGATLPPIIVVQHGKHAYDVISGLHRTAAHERAGRDAIEAWVIEEASDVQLSAVAYAENRDHGVPVAEEHRLRQAAHLVSMGMGQAAAAREMLVDREKLTALLANMEFEQRIASVAPDLINKLPASRIARQRLNSIKRDSVLVQAVRIAAAGNVGQIGIGEMVKVLNRCRTDEDAQEALERFKVQFAEDIQVSAGGRVNGPAQYGKARRALGLFLGVDAYGLQGEMAQLTPTQKDALRQSIEEVRKYMAKVEEVIA